MRSTVKKIWIGFFIIVIFSVICIHFWMRSKLLNAAERVKGGDAILKEYQDGNIGFFELYERISAAKLKNAN